MSIKSTYLITRETALQIMIMNLQKVEDRELADMLESFPESHFRNYTICTQQEIEEDDKEKWPMRKIKTINDF